MSKIFYDLCKNPQALHPPFAKALRYMSRIFLDPSSLAKVVQKMSKIFHDPRKSPLHLRYMPTIFHNPCKILSALPCISLAKALFYISRTFHDPCKIPPALICLSFKSPLIYVSKISWSMHNPSDLLLLHFLQKYSTISLRYFMTPWNAFHLSSNPLRL